MVYGITPQTSSTEEGLKHYRDTSCFELLHGPNPSVTQSPALLTNTIQGTSAFVVPAKRVTTDVSDSNKGALGGRAPLQLTPAFEEAEKQFMGIDILTPDKLTNDGNPAVIVQTESWYDTYGTQFFAVD